MDKSDTGISIWTEVAAIAGDLGRGDRSALTRLYDVGAPRLLRYAEALTRNRADAEDALQSGLVRIAKKPERLAAAEKPWAYLVRVIRNEALKTVQRRRKGLSLASILKAWQPEQCELELTETRQQVQHAVSKLPPEQAEVVVLKIWEEFTFAEIAELIGESPNTAASRYRYALEKLERSLQRVAAPAFSVTLNEAVDASTTRTYTAEVDHD